MTSTPFKKNKIAVIGLGYVGLPLAIEFGKRFKVIAFDLDESRISALKGKRDHTKQITKKDFAEAKFLSFTNSSKDIHSCNIFIITVPTPIYKNRNPDLRAIKNASKLVGKNLKRDDIVIYESTVFPGATEEICVPILERNSRLKFNKDFFCGYSPERINPGDKQHTLTNIKKIVSGSSDSTLETVDDLYSSIIKAGTHKVSSMQIAEAAKVIENTQRDINIALMNELSIIFNKLNLDTKEVLEAAETKWNFIPFKPGLVGGHCIGVDPYYLTYKSQELGYKPEMILSGRKLNNSMPKRVKNMVISLMSEKKIKTKRPKMLFMGLTFKEDCPDIRNSKVLDLINNFIDLDAQIEIYDPWINEEELSKKYRLDLITKPKDKFYDIVILAVPHKVFKRLGIKKIRNFGKKNHVLFDLKGLFSRQDSDGRL